MEMPPTKPALIIAGPTASGKSGLALAVAEEFGGTIINADSMQVYKELRILTARPSEEDEARVPHRLYGFGSASDACSAAQWSELAAAEMRGIWAAGRLPVLAGGTGFYIKAMAEGLNDIPAVPDAVRSEVEAMREGLGAQAFHARLAEVDTGTAERLPAADRQRVIRAMEVYLATGRSLTDWHEGAPVPVVTEARFLSVLLDPSREILNAASDARFDAMLAAGALEEAAALKALRLDAALPAMKSLGLGELFAHLDGDMSLDAAAEAAKQATRRFAKRQQTWFRNQFEPDYKVSAQYSESLRYEIFSNIREFMLTAQI